MSEEIEQKIINESPHYTVTRLLRKGGYEIASSIGIREYEMPDRNGIGILKTKEPVKVKRFLGLVNSMEEPRASFIGMLWMDNNSRDTRKDRNWTLEIYGENNVDDLNSIIQKAAKYQNVELKVELADNNSKLETYLSDFGR